MMVKPRNTNSASGNTVLFGVLFSHSRPPLVERYTPFTSLSPAHRMFELFGSTVTENTGMASPDGQNLPVIPRLVANQSAPPLTLLNTPL